MKVLRFDEKMKAELSRLMENIRKDQIPALLDQMTAEQQYTLLRQLKSVCDGRRRRRDRRKSCVISVIFADSKNSYQGFILNLSNSGLFIETDKAIDVGEDLLLSFVVAKKGERIGVVGKVVRSNTNGVGITFKKRLSLVA